ncbi:Tma23p CYBJADRAFT_120129, partial [Cyberlindnera jadinii NRRL Y-1542]
MDGKSYLKQYGWKEGEALQSGGIKKPILVKHKNDKKGIGHQPNGGVDAWWERLFDGQLKALDVNNKDGDVSFKQEEYVATGVAVSDSPLYRMFVRGETLGGTV